MNSDASEPTGIYEFLAWLEVNKKKLAIGAAVLLVVGFGFYVVRWQSEEKEKSASEALLELKTTFTQPTNPAPASAFLKVAEQFPSTDAAERAALLGAGSLYGEGKYSEAEAQFSKFLKDRASSPLAPLALLGQATSLEAQGKRDDAFTAYQSIVTRYPNSAAVTQARLALGRLYEAKNQPEQAFNVYSDLATNSSAWSSEARMQRDQLLKRFPALEKPVVLPPVNAELPAPTGQPTNAPAVAAPKQ